MITHLQFDDAPATLPRPATWPTCLTTPLLLHYTPVAWPRPYCLAMPLMLDWAPATWPRSLLLDHVRVAWTCRFCFITPLLLEHALAATHLLTICIFNYILINNQYHNTTERVIGLFSHLSWSVGNLDDTTSCWISYLLSEECSQVTGLSEPFGTMRWKCTSRAYTQPHPACWPCLQLSVCVDFYGFSSFVPPPSRCVSMNTPISCPAFPGLENTAKAVLEKEWWLLLKLFLMIHCRCSSCFIDFICV